MVSIHGMTEMAMLVTSDSVVKCQVTLWTQSHWSEPETESGAQHWPLTEVPLVNTGHSDICLPDTNSSPSVQQDAVLNNMN